MKFENVIKNAITNDCNNINGYNIAVVASDKFLSGWGNAKDKTHKQIVLCHDSKQAHKIIDGMQRDNTFKYINYFYISGGLPLNGARQTWSIRTAEDCPLWNN